MALALRTGPVEQPPQLELLQVAEVRCSTAIPVPMHAHSAQPLPLSRAHPCAMDNPSPVCLSSFLAQSDVGSALLSRWDNGRQDGILSPCDGMSLKRALLDTVMLDAEWLADLADAGGICPRCQEVPDNAKVTLAEMEAIRFGGLGVLVISYPWLSSEHPDPNGEQLRRIAFVFRAFANFAKEFPGARFGVFVDYCSMPQKSTTCPPGGDDRTEEDQLRFKRALDAINTFYGHRLTYVLLVDTALPQGGAYCNTQVYAKRGWCVAEIAICGLAKDRACLISLSALTGNETQVWKPSPYLNGYRDLGDLLAGCAAKKRGPPLAPDGFRSFMMDGIGNGTLSFTYGGDRERVCSIYERAFFGELEQAHTLNYSGAAWTDNDVTVLVLALNTLALRGGLKKLTGFSIESNAIGNIGCKAIADALRRGVAPNLETLMLDDNMYGIAGSLAVLRALSGMPRLSRLSLGGGRLGATLGKLRVDILRNILSGRMPYSGYIDEMSMRFQDQARKRGERQISRKISRKVFPSV